MGAIKVKGDTSGSTTITAPATGSDETIELSTALDSKLPYSYGTATPSTTDSGFLWYDSNSTPAEPKIWNGSSFQNFVGVAQAWTPSYNNLTVGNGTVQSVYAQIGDVVTFIFRFTLGSTSSIGSGPQFTLPVNPTNEAVFVGVAQDTGTNTYVLNCLGLTTGTVNMYVEVANSTYTTIGVMGSTVPHTWAATDIIRVTGTYRVA